jgi:uncharacterized protein YdbL (DUF1318 family)
LTFSYFDPNTRKYETARSAPLNVTISPALADTTLTAAQPPPATSNGATPAPATAPAPGMRPDHAVTDAYTDTLKPLYLQRGFLLVPSLLTLAFAGAWLALHRRALPQRPAARRVRITGAWANGVLQRMQAAARARDSVLFFNTARAALQQKLAARWAMNPEEISTGEVQARLSGEEPADTAPEIQRLFALTDEINYAGGVLDADYAHWTEVVRNELSDEVVA